MWLWRGGLILGLLVVLLGIATSLDVAEAKLWRIRISGGDLPHSILIGEYGHEIPMESVNITTVGMVVNVEESEVRYLIESADPDTGNPLGAGSWYYPRIANHPPLLVPLSATVEGNRLVLPPGAQLSRPTSDYETTLNRHILLGRMGLIGERPTRFEVIGKAGRTLSGKVKLVPGDAREQAPVSLTERHGAGLWELLEQVRVSEKVERRSPLWTGIRAYPLLIQPGNQATGYLTFLYYPSDKGVPALLANENTDMPVYELPEQLDRIFRAALGVNASSEGGGAQVWLWPLVGGVLGILGLTAVLVLWRSRVRWARITS